MAYRVVSAPMTGAAAFAPLIQQYATTAGLDPELVNRQVQQESGFDPNAKNARSGATGLIQIMEATAKDPGYGVAPIDPAARTDPETNIRFGTSYLGALRKKYGNDRDALIAYNWGPGNADKWLAAGADVSRLPSETQGYVDKILGGYQPSAQPAAGAAKPKGRFRIVSAAPAAPGPAEAAPAAGQPELLQAGPGAPPSAPSAPSAPETAEANAVVVPPAAMQPPTPEEAQSVAMMGGPETDAGLSMILRNRGLDYDQIGAALAARRGEQEKAAASRETQLEGEDWGTRNLRDSQGRLATLAQGATLGLADDAVGLVAPEAAEGIRQARDQYASDNPLSAFLVSLAGGMAPGAGLTAGLTRTAGAGIPGVSSAARAISTFENAPGAAAGLRNAGRLGAQGAIAGGVDSLGNGGDVATGAALGAVAGAALPPVLKGVFNLGRGVASKASTGGRPSGPAMSPPGAPPPTPAALLAAARAAPPVSGESLRGIMATPVGAAVRKLAPRLGETPQALALRWQEQSALLGRPPSLAEIANPNLVKELSDVASAFEKAGETFKRADTIAARERPGRLAERVVNGQPAASGEDVATAVTARSNAFRNFRDMYDTRQVSMTADEFNTLLQNPLVRRVMNQDPEVARKFRAAEEAFADPDAGPDVFDEFEIRDIESIRESLRQAADSRGGGDSPHVVLSQDYGRARDALTDFASEQVPEYRAALDAFGTASRAIRGMETGRAGKYTRDITDPFVADDLATPEGTSGYRSGLRGRLADEAGSSERGALTAAVNIGEEGRLATTLREAYGNPEGDRLGRVARSELRGAANLDMIARSGEGSPTPRQRTVELAQRAAEGLGAVAGTSSYWFKVRTASKILTRLGMSARDARYIAALTASPREAGRTIRRLQEAGLNETQINDFFRSFAAPAGAAANEMVGTQE